MTLDGALGVWPRRLATPPEEPYPPPPWQARAEFWAGLFRCDRPARLPAGLRPLLGARTRVVTLVRYLPGSALTYDELIIARPALLGARPGLAIEYIWVDSVPSLWGGRRIWGLPKELATFTWGADSVAIADASGPLMTLAVDRSPTTSGPLLPLAIAGIGRLGPTWAYALDPMRLRPGRAGLRLHNLAPRLGFTLSERPLLAVASRDCRVTFPAARLIPARG
ncbi:MAG: acetoacetate decarboxylase family protein [Chloroflexota bacterium]|nr:acetoacetate decarboxylase family protein [Chloroflexota bacterium]